MRQDLLAWSQMLDSLIAVKKQCGIEAAREIVKNEGKAKKAVDILPKYRHDVAQACMKLLAKKNPPKIFPLM